MKKAFRICDSRRGVQNLEFNRRKIGFFCFLLSIFCFASCGFANLEKPECGAARETVKKFYSYHFGNEMKPSPANLQLREKFLTDELKQILAARTDDKTDYFTATDDYPKAFRVGGCTVSGERETSFEVVLFWKDETRSEQRVVKVKVVDKNNSWLIDRVEK